MMALVFATALKADEADTRVQRLVKLCKVWGKVKHFHPYLAYKDIDWDAALVETLPAVYAANSDEEYFAAVKKMLDHLGDPLTTVSSPGKQNEQSKLPSLPESITSKTVDGFFVITFSGHAPVDDFDGYYKAIEKIKGFTKQAATARGILLDLRVAQSRTTSSYISWLFGRAGFFKPLFKGTYYQPGDRSRFHLGFAPQTGMTSGGYYSGFQVTDPKPVTGSGKGEAKPLVFLTNRNSELPQIAPVLQAAGKAVIMAEGPLFSHGMVEVVTVALNDTVNARIRTEELVHADGSLGLTAALSFPEPQTFTRPGKTYKAALDLLKNFKPVSLEGNKNYASARPQKEKNYPDMAYPSRDYRMLALFKAWNVFHYFFPYRDLMDDDWEKALEKSIPKMEQASDAVQYGLTLQEMLTYTKDSHVYVKSEALTGYFGDSVPPIFVRWIEEQPVICRLLDKEETKKAAVAVGDIILEVDGKPVKQRIRELERYIVASTPQSKKRTAMKRLVAGKDNSVITLTIRDAKGNIRDIKLTRKKKLSRDFWDSRSGELFKLLNKDIGYADLDRLPISDVDKMFELFKDTKAIIFDMRGYPKGTAWSIAPRLTDKKNPTAAKFKGIIAIGGDRTKYHYTFDQPISPTKKSKYTGKTVMLINEFTVSQAEHTGLFLESANGTRFIGSGTTGANGDVTSLVLPGKAVARFTGQAVRHADGRQLQRIGLVPHIEVKPTIAGLRQGKDEVLEKAVQYLETQIKN
jgi:C-terminal processing protease CtpA/Prc